MSVEIREISGKSGIRQFIEFGNDLYRDCPNFCPHLVFDEMNTFDVKKNPAHEFCEHVLYMAFRDGRPVGRICGIINPIANERWGVKKTRFGWIDFIDDYEVSKALLDAVAAWGKAHGMTEMNGPVGFTDWDYEGLLIEGFEYLAPMASLYNYPYYEKHMDAYGLTKENDWIEIQVYIPEELPERVDRIRHIAEERYHLRVDKVRSARELRKKYGLAYMDMLDEAYQRLYNAQPMTPRQKQYYSDMYLPMLNFDFVTIVVNENDEIVGIGMGMPDISEALRKCHGHLLPFGWYHIFKAFRAKHMEAFDFLLIGVRPDYQGRGVNAIMMADQHPYFVKYGVKRAETTSIMETNNLNIKPWQQFPCKQHKRRRAYIKSIE